MNRRDFLLLRAGQPAVLSCEQLFMRYLDSQMTGTTTALFAALADDLRAVSAAVVLDMERDVCRNARVVLGGVAPIPWRLPEVERLLAGQRSTPALAAKAGEAAVAGARPLAKNGYKVPLTRAMVARTLVDIADRGLRIAD